MASSRRWRLRGPHSDGVDATRPNRETRCQTQDRQLQPQFKPSRGTGVLTFDVTRRWRTEREELTLSKNTVWATGAAVVMWDTAAVEWYYPALVPGDHTLLGRYNVDC